MICGSNVILWEWRNTRVFSLYKEKVYAKDWPFWTLERLSVLHKDCWVVSFLPCLYVGYTVRGYQAMAQMNPTMNLWFPALVGPRVDSTILLALSHTCLKLITALHGPSFTLRKHPCPHFSEERSHQIRNSSNLCHGTYRFNLQSYSSLLFLPYKIRWWPSSSKINTFTCTLDSIPILHYYPSPPFSSISPPILAQSQQHICAFKPLISKQQQYLNPTFLPTTWFYRMNFLVVSMLKEQTQQVLPENMFVLHPLHSNMFHGVCSCPCLGEILDKHHSLSAHTEL